MRRTLRLVLRRAPMSWRTLIVRSTACTAAENRCRMRGQVFARVSAYRDSMDGPSFDDQGLINTDPRTIAVPAE